MLIIRLLPRPANPLSPLLAQAYPHVQVRRMQPGEHIIVDHEFYVSSFFFLFFSVAVYFFRREVLETIFFLRCFGIFSLRFSRLASLTACLCCCAD